MATKVKPASGIGYGKAFRANPSGLVKPKGFDAEFNAKPQHRAGYVQPPAPGSAPLPWDSVAEGQAATAGVGYNNSIAQNASNRALGESEFGVGEGMGGNGYAYNDYKNNPYSQAAILQHNHESNSRGINTTAGQALYSGQTGNAQTIESGRTNQAHQGIVNEDARANANWNAEEKAAEVAEQEAVNAAKEGAIQRALEATPPEVPLGNGGNSNGGSGGGKEKIPYPAPANKKWAWNGSHWHLVKG
jgi:hypothetical protein